MGHIQRKGSAWVARYRSPNGRERSKSFTRKADAERHLTLTAAAMLNAEWADPRRGRTTFTAWTAQWQSTRLHLADSSRVRDETYLRTLILPFFGERQLGSITRADIDQFLSELTAAGYAPATIRKAYQIAGAVLRSAVDSGLIPKSPAYRVKLPRLVRKEMRILTPAEIDALVNASGPYRALILTATHTGLRWGELAGLRLSRLDLLRRSVTVTETLSEVQGRIRFKEPKTAASRRKVALPRFLANELAHHLETNPPAGDGLVFTASQGGPLRRTNFRRRVWLPAIRATVGEPCRFHDMRHTHAALLIAAGEHPKVIQSRLGHSSIRTTLDTYGHLFTGLDEAAADHLDDLWTQAAAGFTRDPGGNVATLKP